MHAEALLMTLQTLALPAPPALAAVAPSAAGAAAGDLAFAGGEFALGSSRADVARRFVWDNERWSHPVDAGSVRHGPPLRHAGRVCRVRRRRRLPAHRILG